MAVKFCSFHIGFNASGRAWVIIPDLFELSCVSWICIFTSFVSSQIKDLKQVMVTTRELQKTQDHQTEQEDNEVADDQISFSTEEDKGVRLYTLYFSTLTYLHRI